MQALSAVTPEVFAGKFWKHPGHYKYAESFNLVPIAAGELIKVAAHLPLAFVEVNGIWQMVAITSLLNNTNLLVGPQGQWLGEYIPAVLRAYPFQLGTVNGAEDDMALFCPAQGEHLVAEGQGAPFLDAKGKPTEPTQRMAQFLADVHQGRQQLQRAVAALVADKVVVPWELTATHNGQERQVDGLFRLDEQAFSQLSARAFGRLQAEGALPVAYAQLFAREHFSRLQQAIQRQEQLRSGR